MPRPYSARESALPVRGRVSKSCSGASKNAWNGYSHFVGARHASPLQCTRERASCPRACKQIVFGRQQECLERLFPFRRGEACLAPTVHERARFLSEGV